MKQFWEKFIEKNRGEYFAREEFDRLCIELLEYHYPGKQLINANKIDRLESFHDLLLVYLPKLFLDSLNVSKKSQIRKAFNKTVEAIEQRNLKVYKWIFCTTHKLTASELKWWNQWKYKNSEQYHIDIELLDGEQIYNLLKKYDLLYKIDSLKQDNQTQKESDITQAQDSLFDLELDLEIDSEQQSEKQEKTENQAIEPSHPDTTPVISEQEQTEQLSQAEVQTNADSEQNLEQEQQLSDIQQEKSQEQQPEKEHIEISSQEETAETQAQEQNSQGEQLEDEQQTEKETDVPLNEKLSLYYKHKKSYKSITKAIKELEPEESKKFEQLRKLSQFSPKDFDDSLEQKELMELKVYELFLRARSAEVNGEYDKALLYYEILHRREEELKKELKAKVLEVKSSLKFVEKKLLFEQKVLLGDLYLAKGKKLEALEQYEEAYKLDKDNREIRVKYNEVFGDLLMESGLYKEAKKAYSEAIKALKPSLLEQKNQLKKKQQLASLLNFYSTNKWLPLVADIALFTAKSLEDSLEEKLVNRSVYYRLNYTSIGLGIIIGLLLVGWIFYKIYPEDKNEANVQPVAQDKIKAKKAWDLYEVAMYKGYNYLNAYKIYGYMRVNLLDSAIDAYQRAWKFRSASKAAYKGYVYSKQLMENYKNKVQRDIITYPKKYFRLISKPSEGLAFFEYIIDQKNKLGKYGYIDTNMNVIIPPIFDYDYHRHLPPGKEQFHNGHAWACLIVGTKMDTAYFMIDRTGRCISKIYVLKHRKQVKKTK